MAIVCFSVNLWPFLKLFGYFMEHQKKVDRQVFTVDFPPDALPRAYFVGTMIS